jgi:hypothetical protein
MSLNITRQDAERLLRTAQNARASIKRAKEHANEAVDRVVQTVEVGSTAFGFGILNGRFGGVEVLGVPLDALASFSMHGLAFFGVAPDHLHNFGDGAMASYLTTTGAGIGRAMAVRAGAAAPMQKAASGWNAFPRNDSPNALSGQSSRLTDQQLAQLAQLAAA